MKENKSAQVKPLWRETDAVKKAMGFSCCPLGCLMVLHGRSRHIAVFCVHSWLQCLSPGSSCGEGGRRRCGFDLSLSVCVSVWKSERDGGRERTRDSEGFMWSTDARGNVLYCASFPQDVKHLCWSGGVMCEVHSTRSTAGKVWCWTPMWDVYGDVGGYWVVLLFRDHCLNAWQLSQLSCCMLE